MFNATAKSMKSDLQGFYDLSLDERLSLVKKLCSLTEEEADTLRKTVCLPHSDRMIENVVGTIELPLGIATNFIVNGRDMLVPMAIEEPSVVAAASHAAKLARPEGFEASSDEPIMIGQIQLLGAGHGAAKKILENRNSIIEIAHAKDSVLVKLGGGLKNIEVREIETERGMMTIVHLLVNVQDAMGANAVNTMCEEVAPFIENLVGGRSLLKIISNLAVYRKTRARTVWKKEALGGDIIEGILDAYAFAKADPFRCATHNKGIMNGIDAVLIATGNDFRAAEAGAHAFAAIGGYKPLTKYWKNENGDLVGEIELPLVAGIVGGSTNSNPIAKISLKILNVKQAHDLSEVAACAGLANNFAALRAMVKEGIQKGHMKLHAHNIALTAGATHAEAVRITDIMLSEKKISVARASELLEAMRR